jgi:hypothetical protein
MVHWYDLFVCFNLLINILIKFTQLALDTPEGKVEKILYQVWKIFPPRLIMSIIGGAKYFTLSDRLEMNFINGIINVALKSGMNFDDIYLNL